MKLVEKAAAVGQPVPGHIGMTGGGRYDKSPRGAVLDCGGRYAE